MGDRDEDYPLINRAAPKVPDRLAVKRMQAFNVEVVLTPADLFGLLGIPLPPTDTEVHILLARSHGNEGSCYLANGGCLVCEVRMKWELPLDGR